LLLNPTVAGCDAHLLSQASRKASGKLHSHQSLILNAPSLRWWSSCCLCSLRVGWLLTVEQMFHGVWCHSTLRTNIWYAAGDVGLVCIQEPTVTRMQLDKCGINQLTVIHSADVCPSRPSVTAAKSHLTTAVRPVDWQARSCWFKSCSLLYKWALLLRKALANHLINGSGLDRNWELWMRYLKPASSQYTRLSVNSSKID